MDFAERVYKYLYKYKVLEVGEVRLRKAYLYSDGYEIFITTLYGKKVVEVVVRRLDNREVVLIKRGTVNGMLGVASGYVRHNPLSG